MVLIDWIALAVVRGFLGLINAFPLGSRLWLVRKLMQGFAWCVPSLKRVSLRNMAQVFPGKEKLFYEDLYDRSLTELARLLVDFARLPSLDKSWVDDHVECPFLPRFLELKQMSKGRGVIIVTGHVGSFELLAHSISLMGYPLSFIVRNFSLPSVDAWWTASRQRYGNEVIPRKGAVKKVLANLNQGKDVALLFDQNVKRNHAVFVPFFGRTASAAQTLGLAAIRTEAKIVVSTICYIGNDRYRIEAEELSCDDVYKDEGVPLEDRICEITRRANCALERMILKFPEGWFWMHRRWKTTPEGVAEDFYK